MRQALPNSEGENAGRVARAVQHHLAGCEDRTVFLVDGDRTLTPDDTSRVFLSRSGGDPLVIKRNFERLGYIFEAFRVHADAHLTLATTEFERLAHEVAAEVRLHHGADSFLRLAHGRAKVVVVSSGLPSIWRLVLEALGLPDVGVIGGIDPADPFVFGRTEKGLVAEMFVRRASKVVAVGDSDVDTEMLLRAHDAVVVMNHRRNDDLLPHVGSHPSLWQIGPEGMLHPDIPVVSFDDLAYLAESAAEARPTEVETCR